MGHDVWYMLGMDCCCLTNELTHMRFALPALPCAAGCVLTAEALLQHKVEAQLQQQQKQQKQQQHFVTATLRRAPSLVAMRM